MNGEELIGRTIESNCSFLTGINYSAFVPEKFPVRHKRKVPFSPYPKLFKEYKSIQAEIVKMDAELGNFILGADDYLNLVLEAYSSNIHWSTRIEGNPLTFAEVSEISRLFTSGKRMEIRNGYVQEIINHLQPMFQDQQPHDWNSEYVKEIHRNLLQNTGDFVKIGEYRNVPVHVVSPEGFEHFIGCPETHVPEEMDSLLDWLDRCPFDTVCTAAVFFHEFESIHPFEDGNGRTGRVLMQNYLQESGLKHCNLCMFEMYLLDPDGPYYDLLSYTDATGDYGPFIMYFTECLFRAYDEAVVRFGEKDRLRDADSVSRTIVNNSRKISEFSIHDAVEWIPDVHENTVRSRISDLVEQQVLRKTGSGRGTRYSFNDPKPEVRKMMEMRS